MKIKTLPFALIMVVIAVCAYFAFTLVAFIYYPKAYSPLTNWLSDLGNPISNPSGAIYYDTGAVVTSIALILSFAGMYRWNTGDKKMKVFLALSQVSGIILALAFMVTAFFPLGINDSIHSSFSIILFISIGFFELFSASAIRRDPSHVRWIPYFGISAAVINFALGVSFNFGSLFIGEWIMIGLFIAYIITLTISQNRQFIFIKPKGNL